MIAHHPWKIRAWKRVINDENLEQSVGAIVFVQDFILVEDVGSC
jgi:hypothetical protein